MAVKNVFSKAICYVNNAALLYKARRAGNDIELSRSDLWRIRIKCKKATGNIIRIAKLGTGTGVVNLRLGCKNSRVEIGPDVSVSGELSVILSTGLARPSNVSVRIGSRTSFGDTSILAINSNSSVEIGHDCMIAYGVTFHHTDVHPIYDAVSGRIVNRVGSMKIGDHVWIGAKATLMKNVDIADDCIVGFGSVVSGKFRDQHVVIAGNPARVVSKNGRRTTWKARDDDYFCNETGEVTR